MFNSASKKKSVTAQDLQNETILSVISKDAEISGTFRAEGSTRIDGRIDGNVEIRGSLIVGPEARIDGNLTAANVALAGTVNGDIFSPDGLVTLSDTSRVVGDITTSKIVIDENAYFKGRCNMPAAEDGEEGKDDSKDTDDE